MDAVVELDRLTGAIVADLPKPPTDNHLYTVARGRKIMSRDAREFRDLVAMACRLGRVPTLEGRLAMSITFHPATAGKNDIANRVKALCDAMTGHCYADDSQIDDLRIVRGPVVAGGRVKVRVIEIQGNAA